ncbi:MAG: C39 family peptidase [Patescibacteria group bacterium]
MFFPLSLFLSAAVASSSLQVPYVSQVPDGAWVAPWDEACEEASIVMIDGYYHRTGRPTDGGRAQMQSMIDWENETFKVYKDTDANQTVQLIRHEDAFGAVRKQDPSLVSIKRELKAKRPVIALVNMYALYGEQSLGDSYHVLVITGYDDDTKEFIVNDPARERKTYAYDTVMDALHDYNPNTKEADGTPTVIFTYKKGLASSFFTFVQNLFRR